MNLSRLIILLAIYFAPFTVQASDIEILDKTKVESLFQKKLGFFQQLISENRIDDLQAAVKEFTKDDTLILLEFSLKMPGQEALPAKKAYFNRDPFIMLMKNATYLDKESFEISYTLDKFQPQYGGSAAIIFDRAEAKGQLTEAFSGELYQFNMSQKCRNTISADIDTTFKVDSVYCRMEIDYSPVNAASVTEAAGGAPNDPEKNKADIRNIMGEIEAKKEQELSNEKSDVAPEAP